MISPYLMPGVARYTRPVRKADTDTANEIIAIVAKYKGVSKTAILGHGRAQPACAARHLAIYFIRSRTKLTCKKIGELFSGRDHSSVLHAIKTVGDLSAAYRETREEIFELQNLIIYGPEQKNIVSIRATQGAGNQ